MRHNRDFKTEEEVQDAHGVAIRGAVSGAARWGLFAAVVGTTAQMFSPIFRGVTVQYKVFLGLASITMGGMIEADRRMIAYELVVRQRKRQQREMKMRKEYEQQFEEVDDATLEKQIRQAELRSQKSRRRETNT